MIHTAPRDISERGALGIAGRKVQTAERLVVQALHRVCRQSDFTWRYIANLGPWWRYQRVREPLGASQARLIADLKQKGIATVSVQDILGSSELFEELEATVWKREAALADGIDRARQRVGSPDVKSYLIPLLGRPLRLDPDDIFVRFPLHPKILAVANAYYGMFTKLRYFNVWHTFPTQDPPRESQLWHRDPEDRYILKMFVYLTDVDEGAGPLTYAPGTHTSGAVKRVESRWVREGANNVRRSDDAQVAAVVPRESWITAVGPKGTVVLADTRGFHKGGLARERERILYMCMFNSQASSYPDVFERKVALPRSCDRAMAFAIGA